MTDSLIQNSGKAATFAIYNNGSKVKDLSRFKSITVNTEVNRISNAVIKRPVDLSQGSIFKDRSDDFAPGNRIDIELGYEDNNKPVFKGIVVSQRLSFSEQTALLIVECKSNAIETPLPEVPGESVLKVTYGIDLLTFNAELLKSKPSRFNGTFTFLGNADAKPGRTIELVGLDNLFNKNVYVGSVTHHVEQGVWTTEAGIGVQAAKPLSILNEEDYKYVIVTPEKLRIEMDDKKKAITITTPNKNTITLSDDDKGIVLTDRNNNKLAMDESGIKITSGKDITLSAKGKINIDAFDASVTSKGNVDIEGMRINAKAKVEVKINGSARAELSASGQTIVKGAMVMIN